MIQFNLLPDVKIEYIKTLRLKRTVMLFSLIAIGASVGLLLLMFSMRAVQKQHLTNLDNDISRLTEEINQTEDLTRILSVQNQLNALPGLYDGRPALNRLSGFVDQTTPVGIGITQMMIDFSTSQIEIVGDSVDAKTVNSFVDTLRYTTYKDALAQITEGLEEQGAPSAFGNLNLLEFDREPEKATFTLSFQFDPAIFDVKKQIQLTVPSLVTTRAEVPSADLFNGAVPLDGTTQTGAQ